jgi:hypothetical protein
MNRSASLTSEMSLKTRIGWMAVAFIVWWTIEQPTNAAHLAHNIGTFFSAATAGISAFLASIPTSTIMIPILVIASVMALVVALIVIRRLTQSARRRWDAPTATSLLRGVTRFSALLAGRRRPDAGQEWQGEISSADTPRSHYAGATTDGNGRRAGWSAAWGVVAVLAGSFAAPLWISVLTTGPGLLIWPACAPSVVALVGLYMCFAFLGGWWPIRVTSIAGKRPEEPSGLPSPEPAEFPQSFSGASNHSTRPANSVTDSASPAQ